MGTIQQAASRESEAFNSALRLSYMHMSSSMFRVPRFKLRLQHRVQNRAFTCTRRTTSSQAEAGRPWAG